jgi:hypothetical protein
MKKPDLRESALKRPDLLHCPACYMLQDCSLKDFRCTLERCPQVFVSTNPARSAPTPPEPIVVPDAADPARSPQHAPIVAGELLAQVPARDEDEIAGARN